MASRTKQKEAARARRLAEEQARQERERRDRRLRVLGGVILAAIAVVAVAIAISSGGGSSTGLLTGAKATQLSAQVNGMFAGIPQNGSTLGNPKAPVTMTYYGDLQCPVCQDFTVNGGFPQLVANDVRAGKVKIVYRSFQTATQSAQTFQTQQVAALAAGKQGHFWNYADLFYRQQGAEGSGYVNENYLTGLAKQIPGLNLANWSSARNDPSLPNQVTADETAGHSIGVQGTPTLVFSGPKGQQVTPSSVPSYSELESTIKTVS